MRNKVWAWIIGTGVVLLAIHNPMLTPTINGVTWLFLPQLGLIMALMSTFVCLGENYKRITFGSKWLWIPLAIIAGSIISSEIIQYAQGNATSGEAIGKCGIAVFMFLLYLIARILGEELFKPFTVTVVVVAISCVVFGILDVGKQQGGLASPTNYDMAAGLLMFGTLVTALKHKWWVSSVALVGLFFTGAGEAIFAVGVLFIALLLRHDWSKKLLLPASLVVVGIILLIFTNLSALYKPIGTSVELLVGAITTDTGYVTARGDELISIDNREYQEIMALTPKEAINYATGDRYLGHWRISPIKPFGYGFTMDEFYYGIPHNVALVIIEQVGILAAIAWLFAIGFCLIKTKWRYAFIGLLALSVLDHYIWTQVAPWQWALIGVASASNIKSDYIFKGVADV